MNASTLEQRKSCDVLIEPDLRGLSGSDFAQARQWIERGEAAARAILPELRRLSPPAAPGAAAPRDLRLTAPETLTARALSVRGLTPETERFVESAMRLSVPGPISADTLDAAIASLVGVGAFERVTYQVAGPPDAAALTVDAVDGMTGALGFGFRYDSRYQASLLFDAAFRNLSGFGSTTHVTVRLGDEFQLTAQHLRGASPRSRFLSGAHATYAQAPIDIFDNDFRIAQVKVDVANVSGFAGMRLGRRGLATVRLKGEHASGATEVSAIQAEGGATYYTIAGTFSRESLDRPAFPRIGASIFISSEGASRAIGSGARFWEHILDAQAAVPVRPNLSLVLRVMTGASGGADLPFHYQFFLGGSVPSAVFSANQPTFPGLKGQARVGRAVQLLQVGAQFELANQLILAGRIHAGNTADRWRVPLDRYVGGYEIAVGAITAIGPIEIAASGRNAKSRPRLDIRLGRRF